MCLNFMMKIMKQFWVIYHKRLFITITTSSLTSNFKDIAICELQMYLQDDEAIEGKVVYRCFAVRAKSKYLELSMVLKSILIDLSNYRLCNMIHFFLPVIPH